MPYDFARLNFDSFQRMAEEEHLTQYEKIGFPNSYRQGFEEMIFADIAAKLSLLGEEGKTVLDIGPGCSNLPRLLIEHCKKQGHQLLLADSESMLAHLPDASFIRKIPGRFPDTAGQIKTTVVGGVDVILCYSVLHYLLVDTNIYDAVNAMVRLLNPGGEMLIGDIPNLSMRKRFFSSAKGIEYHRQFTGQDGLPSQEVLAPESAAIDDQMILSLLAHIRAAGADAYVVPQATDLPMANRREDILVRKP